METLIAAHEGLDFDGLAASVAAARLYPGATIGVGGALGRDVQPFLALHRDRFATALTNELDLGRVERLVVVDVRDRRRLGHIEPLLARLEQLDVHVYDHHPPSGHDLVGRVEVVEQVGAATTILVERLAERGVEPDPVEATLFLLGIYADTAALTLGSTSARDAHAAARLLERGASLAMVNRYLEPPFSEAQRAALTEVLARTERVELAPEHPIGVAAIERPAHVGGLAEVVTEACRLAHPRGALFVLCAVGKRRRVQVIGRSRSPAIDVGAALRALGGGGHPGAGAATLKGADLAQAEAALLGALAVAGARPPCVADLMSRPVHTVPPELSLEELGARLRAWGHSGVPVVRDGTLLGVVSRRDVRRAARAGRLGLPVSSHMGRPPRSTTRDASLEAAIAAMVEADVGRLPVLDGGRLVGIVSRSDLLRALY